MAESIRSHSLSPPPSPNPIPQKPVLARINNNNSGLRRASVTSSPLLDKHSDDVSLVDFVPINVALDILGGNHNSSSAERLRIFDEIDKDSITPPAAIPSQGVKHKHYFNRPEDVGHDTPLISRQEPFFPIPPTHTKEKHYFSRPDDIPHDTPLCSRNDSFFPVHQTKDINERIVISPLANNHQEPQSPSFSRTKSETSLLEISSINEQTNIDNVSIESQNSEKSRSRIPRKISYPQRNLPNNRSERRYRSSGSINRGGGSSGSGGSSTGSTASLKQNTDGPVRKPNEALSVCQIQLGNQEWGVVMEGLTMLNRLVKFHSDVVAQHLHSIVGDVARHIKNLRSQVARLACTVAGNLALTLKRGIETELEELIEPLLHRTADTNKFLRQDCGHALDLIMQNAPPSKTIPAIISQGAAHKNAIVRATAARLLAQVVARLGVEKIMGNSSPGAGITRDVRTKILRTAANLLTEGSQETRMWAKKTFEVVINHETFDLNMMQAVQPNVLRSIQKSLSSIPRT